MTDQYFHKQGLAHDVDLVIKMGDLTLENVDAIVNAANAYLLHVGGVARAIVRRGGLEIQTESDNWIKNHGPISHTQPAWTNAGGLKCRYIIHAVGPVWGEGQEDRKLTQAILSSLHVAEELGLKSVAFPAISTGIFGFPKDRSARVFAKAISDFLNQLKSTSITQIIIVLLDQEIYQYFIDAFSKSASTKDN
jgi:O-acetyl-ADP-ribose deacetylase (regulator of RNase III)